MCLQEDEEREKRSEEHRERMKKEHKKNIEVSRFIFAEGCSYFGIESCVCVCFGVSGVAG